MLLGVAERGQVAFTWLICDADEESTGCATYQHYLLQLGSGDRSANVEQSTREQPSYPLNTPSSLSKSCVLTITEFPGCCDGFPSHETPSGSFSLGQSTLKSHISWPFFNLFPFSHFPVVEALNVLGFEGDNWKDMTQINLVLPLLPDNKYSELLGLHPCQSLTLQRPPLQTDGYLAQLTCSAAL